jgi:murein hydrolase activator
VKRQLRKIVCFLALAIFAAVSILPGEVMAKKRQESTNKRADLKKLKSELEKKETLVKKLKTKEVSILGYLDEISRQMKNDSDRLSILENEKNLLVNEISTLNTQIGALHEEMNKTEARISARLASSYKMGKTGFLKVLLASESYSDFARKKYYLKSIVQSQNRMMEAYMTDERELSEKMDLLAKRKAGLESLSLEANARIQNLNRAKGDKLGILKAVRSEKELSIKSMRELGQAARELERMIVAIPRRKNVSHEGQFSKKMGNLVFPINGNVTAKYGEYYDPSLGVRMFSKGVGISIKDDQKVHSVDSGKIIYSGAFRGYGNIIIVDHGENYYSLYARLKTLKKIVGDSVVAGDEIATAGDPLSSGPQQFYFELRHNGQPIDPVPWFPRNSGLK